MSAVVDSSETFDGFEESSLVKRPMYTDRHHSEFAFHRFSLLREKNILTDTVILSSDEKRFNVHSAIMAGTSDYFFSQLLNSHDHETLSDYISLDQSCQLNVDSETLELIIAFCYSGGIELTIDNIESVLIGATDLQIESLLLVCEEMIQETLDANNCIRFLEISDKYGLDALKDTVLELISLELPDISRLPEFYQLTGTQMYWLIKMVSKRQAGIFDGLLTSLKLAENAFSSITSKSFPGSETQSAIRAAFIAGYFQGQINNTSLEESGLQISTNLPQPGSKLTVLPESDLGSEEEFEANVSISHTLCIFRRKSIQFNSFCEIEQKWERLPNKVDVPHSIESFRDVIMIPYDQNIFIFHMENGSVSRIRNVSLNSGALENVVLPNNIQSARLALFCQLDDKIYCFARTEQQSYHRFDPKSKSWSPGQIDEMMDAKYIIGFKGELYFIGCGYSRTVVRSYHIGKKQWTARGNLRHENKETCFKAITLNGFIYVVMSCFDSAKIYNGTEFVVQRYDENVDDWIIIRKVYYTHYVDHFHLDVSGNSLYLFYGEGEVQIYNEELNEWHKGPSIDCDALDVSMCMIMAEQSNKTIVKQSFQFI